MMHITMRLLTSLNEQLKAGKWEPTAASQHLLVDIKIAIPVLSFISSYTSVDAGLCVNDDCFDLPAFVNHKFQSQL